ncbi:MAG: thioredoxin family protein [Phycisphaerales bacterium]|nr:thioredoxin family protein [Phycisphaerales bacterium]
MSDSFVNEKPARRSFAAHYVLLGALVIGLYWFVNQRAESQLEWLNDLDTAVARAQSKEIPVLLDFWADWCGPCLELDNRIFSSDAVASVASKNYVPMRVDLSGKRPSRSHEEIAKHYGVETIPTILVLDAVSRKVIARASHDDEASPEAFVRFLKLHSR